MSAGIGCSDVEVAGGRLGGGAADGGLLDHALGDFLAEVEGVELGDGGHDSVHEHAGWCFVDVLGDRDEGDSGVAEGGVDHRVVEPVPGKSVDLVDDAVADRVVGDVVEHSLQCPALCGFRRLTGFDELFNDHRSELAGLACGSIPLCGY
nr:hypothetical protein [Microlunatus speluncae]